MDEDTLSYDAPWLVSVSDDLSKWEIRDVSGPAENISAINLDIAFCDGSRLTEPESKELFVCVLQYMEILRIYMPNITATVHRGRVTALLTFIYWLHLYKIGNLRDVTPDHIQLYSRRIAFGMEWASESPQRLLQFLQRHIAAGGEIPRALRNKKRIDNTAVLGLANVNWPDSCYSKPLCSAILRWLETRNCQLPAESTVDDILAASDRAIQPLTIQAVQRSLLPLEELWLWKHQIAGSNFRFNPFPKGSSKVANSLGRESKRHRTIPPKVAIKYIGDALKWVIDYSPIILQEFSGEFNCDRVTGSLVKAGLRVEVVEVAKGISPHSNKVDRLGLIRLLAAACFVVIASLSARRLDEITDLGFNCSPDRDTDSDGCWLTIYIEKTSQRYEQTPIPASVQRAINCMESVSKVARMATGSDSIWQWQRKVDGEYCSGSPQLDLNNLAQFSSVLTDEEKKWRFSSHQFRRFFAIVYFWWYEKGDIAALSHCLRHDDLERTRRYVTDSEFGKLWREIEQDWQAQFLRDVVGGGRSIGGIAGTRLKRHIRKLSQHFRKYVDVVAADRVVQKLIKLSKRWGTEYKQHVWGTICACPQRTSYARYAHCKGVENTGPVFANATEASCAMCPFAIHTERFAHSAEEALSNIRDVDQGLTDGSIISELSVSNCNSLQSAIERGDCMPITLESHDEQ